MIPASTSHFYRRTSKSQEEPYDTMGSDSLDKPGKKHVLWERSRIYRNKALIHMHRFKLTSSKKWTRISRVILSCLVLLLALACYLVNSISNFALCFLGICWNRLILVSLKLITDYLVPHSMKVRLARFNWVHIGFKLFSCILLAMHVSFAIALIYLSPWGPGGGWPDSRLEDVRYLRPDTGNYFNDFRGARNCNITAADLYAPPTSSENGHGYCNSRTSLLQAMSGGGRRSFGTPYVPHGCHYRWFCIEEICTILDRFDSLVFVGDQNLEMIYAGLNILLRKDLRHGALRVETGTDELDSCTCDRQLTNPSCYEWLVRSSKEVHARAQGRNAKPYTCERVAHAFLSVREYPAPADIVPSFNTLVQPAPLSNYKSIPIIHSVTSNTSIGTATHSLDEFLTMADATKRKTPVLWIGPTATEHIGIEGEEIEAEMLHFAAEMARTATEKGLEMLGMWNLTLQADSSDDNGLGKFENIVAAMMVVNWLARLESS